MKIRRASSLLLVGALMMALCLVSSTSAALKLKKLAKAVLLGAAIAPRFVPIPIPHHVHKEEHHGWHDHSHGWQNHGWSHRGWSGGHGHEGIPVTFSKGGWDNHYVIHDSSSASHGHPGW